MVTNRRRRAGRIGLYLLVFIWLALLLPISVAAAPYAAMVMDARSGKVLHSRNADTRLHPASLTKMMTLYIAFEAVQRGELSMDTVVTISRKAAAEPPSKLGLRPGARIKLRYLVRAAAVKSANDAATAIAEAISGSEAAFARRMNRTAKALGMRRTTFRNAHGLTEKGHLSTARDMTLLGRHVLYDYPQYYNIFARRSADAGIKTVPNTNRRLLANYRGADGIKTGYTRAAGFNLVASAERGRERIIATVFGGNSTASRNARVAELLDMGFRRAPTHVTLRKPKKPPYLGNARLGVEKTESPDTKRSTRAKSIRVARAAVTRSLRPIARPRDVGPIVADLQTDLAEIIAEVAQAVEPPRPAPVPASALRPETVLEEASLPAEAAGRIAEGAAGLRAPARSMKPERRPESLRAEALAARDVATPGQEAEIVTRLSTSGGHNWGITVGRFPDSFSAEEMLLKTALAETATLDGALRKVVRSPKGFDANFMGLTRDTAELACRRLKARQITCFMVGPG